MHFDPKRHHRKSIRLKGYDYRWAGAYFVTINVENHKCLLGEIINESMVLSRLGVIVQEEWQRSPLIRSELLLDEFVVMPNHFHGIVTIIETIVGATGRSPKESATIASGATDQSPLQTKRPSGPAKKSLSAFIGGFKASTTKRINLARGTPNAPFWQRGYYEHIIRSTKPLGVIQNYIATNPSRWGFDKENINRTGSDEFERWLTSQGVQPVGRLAK